MPPSSKRDRKTAESDSSAARAQLQRETSETEWEEARQEAHDLKEIQNRAICSVEVMRLAEKWGVARATVFRKLSRFREGGGLAALLPRRPGKRLGSSTVDPEIEFIIQESARRLWALSENATIEDVFAEVAKICRARQLGLPSRATVGRRVQNLRADPSNFAGEARHLLRERRRLVKSNYSVGKSLAVVQIDHTVADILLVEPHTHCLVGRPTLTIAIDVATRCVMGFCASLEAPSSLLVALCLEPAVFPKDWLENCGPEADWPMYGLMKSIHSDNGREFHGQAFRRGCDLNGIDTIYRPPATPRFGGHIERLIGTFMRRTRLLPGNTYSDMLGRRPREAESKATLTLRDYRSFLIEEVERYHNRVHRTLGTSPRSAWERAWKRSRGVEAPAFPDSRERFLLDFLPVRNRVVTREGIEIDGLRFSHESLQREVGPSVKRVVRIDPRDVSRIYLETSKGPYLPIPLRAGPTMPTMSWWEWKAIRRQRHAQGESLSVVDFDHNEFTTVNYPTIGKTALRVGRARARRAEWQALQAIQSLPTPDTSLRPIVCSDPDSPLPHWEILD